VISRILAGITYQWGSLVGFLLAGISVDCNAAVLPAGLHSSGGGVRLR
jgi:hypothetical protein